MYKVIHTYYVTRQNVDHVTTGNWLSVVKQNPCGPAARLLNKNANFNGNYKLYSILKEKA